MGMTGKDGRAGYYVYRNPRWAAIRLQAKRRDGFRCAECGASGRLEIHHKIPLRQAPDLAFDLGNLLSLCPTCHQQRTMAERGHEPDPDRLAWRTLLRKATPNAGIRQNPNPAV
jgi:5-methylcytosine-specific restriction endonuclease McrA